MVPHARLRSLASGRMLPFAGALLALLSSSPAHAASLGVTLPFGLPPGPPPEVLSIDAEERVSNPFRVDVVLRIQLEVSDEDVLGRPVAAWAEEPGQPRRWFHGLVSGLTDLGTDAGGLTSYRLELQPTLGLMSDSGLPIFFGDRNALSVVQGQLAAGGVTDVDVRTTGSYPEREAIVQYGETDLAFVSRLMEEEGIFYFFEHGPNGHVMVLADSNDAFDTVPGVSVPFVGEGPAPPGIATWELRSELRTGVYSHDDYDFLHPSTDLTATASQPLGVPFGDGEIFEYPGGHRTVEDGVRLALVRLQALQSGHVQASGDATTTALVPGSKFTLTGHPRFDGDYHVVRAVHHVSTTEPYRTRFVVQRTADAFRPERVTPKPRIAGVQTAVVVGPEGEEVYTDPFGRVKVQFHWDRAGQHDENSSSWLRVMQDFDPSHFGSVQVPRIGEEVVVGFLEGDPDRPMVLGGVYNAETMPPFGLPGGGPRDGLPGR